MSEQAEKEVPWWRNDPWLGAHLFTENRNKNCDLLRQYDWMWVAWFPDGSGIRDADADCMEMRRRIEESGEDPSWYCYEYSHPAGE